MVLGVIVRLSIYYGAGLKYQVFELAPDIFVFALGGLSGETDNQGYKS